MRTKDTLWLLVLPVLAACAGGNPTTGATAMLSTKRSVAGAARLEASDGADESRRGPRKLVKSVWLVFEIDDEGPARRIFAQRVSRVVADLDGYVAAESHTSLTLRVPADRLDETVEALGKIDEIVDRGHRVADVSRAHRDLTVRIENAKKLQARLRSLLDKTEDVKTLVQVEKELSRVTTELETLEAELRNLDRNVALATITVDFRDEVSPGPVGWLFYGMYRGIKWLFVWD